VGDREHVKELFCNSFAYIHGHTVGGTNPTLLHALGCGCCILARDNHFNAEVLDGRGLLFRDAADLGAKIRLIEEQPQLAQSHRRSAPDRIRDVYNWERIAHQYEELFYQLVAGEDPSRIHSTVAGEPSTVVPDMSLRQG
jgi:glycosyltransferase involved in cell wall biosynthesis